jgi:glutaminyl-peptide cyclotransferase
VKKKLIHSAIGICIPLFLFTAYNCNTSNNDSSQSNKQDTLVSKNLTDPSKTVINIEPSGAKYKCGQIVKLSIKAKDQALTIDSAVFTVNNIVIGKQNAQRKEVQWETSKAGTGLNTLIAKVYLPGGKTEGNNITVELLSDIVPKEYGYNVIKTYPHDPNAYTQGLIYENNNMYEGTGVEGQSSLRKTKLETGDVLYAVKLPNDIFGEGITILDDKIYQISWKSQVCFVYNKKTFATLNKIMYRIAEGWGLTNNGKDLIMSDGSNTIYFLDPSDFVEKRKIQVYDNKGPVDRLNELEYINGMIYANVYTTDYIVIIDPSTGKIVGKATMSGLLNKGDMNNNTDVLNGIAYDKKEDRLFVTGKNWPKLFEVKLIGK